MTRSEYEQRRRALEQQFQADLELLRAAHEVRVRSLDQLWQTLGKEETVSPVPIGTQSGIGTRNGIGTQAPPAKAVPVRRRYGVVDGEVEEALSRLPEVFDKLALIRELGYEPPRSTLHRVLEGLTLARRIAVETRSEGRTPTRYRKLRGPEGREG